MGCSHCGGDLVAFAVPETLREHAPGGGEFAALCSVCLRVEAADPSDVAGDADFSAVTEAFPSGRGGVTTALLLGKLDSLALNRSAIVELANEAERGGADLFLTLNRLASTPTVDPHFDIDRRRPQLEQVLE